MYLPSILILLLCLFSAEAEVEYTSVRHTHLGPIRGIVQRTHDGKKVDAYLGLRYATAKPFEEPSMQKSWRKTYEATHARFACPQPGMLYEPGHVFKAGVEQSNYSSLDCLFMNVWVPEGKKTRSVMVWIHGGAWKYGSIWLEKHDGRELASHGDVIVVSIAYRLGIFGVAPNDHAPSNGNYGISDLKTGLEFIRNIIHAFGGDPNSVTVFGESAGSANIGKILLDSPSLPYFQRAIMMSGTPIVLERSKEEGMTSVLDFAKKVGCGDGQNIDKAINCLKGKDVPQLIEAIGESFLDFSGMPIYSTQPAVDRLKALDMKFDLIYGTVKNEVGALYHKLKGTFENTSASDMKIVVMMQFMEYNIPINIDVYNFYNQNLTASSTGLELLEKISEYAGDMFLSCPTLAFGDYLSRHPKAKHRNSKHYSYLFSQNNQQVSCDGQPEMACHASDVFYVFGVPLRSPYNVTLGFGEQDAKVSRAMMTAWASFAKTGDPGTIEGTRWSPSLQPHLDNSSHYFEFSADSFHMNKDLFKDRCDFWNKRWGIQM